jgi:hypothetical protein
VELSSDDLETASTWDQDEALYLEDTKLKFPYADVGMTLAWIERAR